MQTQLRDRYLRDSRCRNGLYLVGWFSSHRWDEKDYRKKNIPNISLEEARQFFLQQAADLSTNGYHIKSCALDGGIGAVALYPGEEYRSYVQAEFLVLRFASGHIFPPLRVHPGCP
jgi:hypothetical protein